MSEKSRCDYLRWQIYQLDEQFRFREEAQEFEEILRTVRLPHGLCSFLRIGRAHHLREIYHTGCIARRPLPTHTAPVPPLKIPPEVLRSFEADHPTGSATVKAKTYLNIPDELLHELLWPKRKRGRTRNETRQALAKSHRCTERHARRLFTSGNQRKRVRERPSTDEEWALEQRKKRAELVQALKQENVLNCVASVLDILRLSGEKFCLLPKVSVWARRFAKDIITKRGGPEALLMCSFALPSVGLHFVSKTLGWSRSTIYRKIPSRQLDSLRSDGEILRAHDPSQLAADQIRRKEHRRVTQGTANAWSQQTNFASRGLRNGRSRNFRARFCDCVGDVGGMFLQSP